MAQTSIIGTEASLSQAEGPTVAGQPDWSEVQRDDRTVVLRHRHATDPQPADWPARLTKMLHDMPGVGAIGAKRITDEGKIASMGEFVIHPKGFHHVGQGMAAAAYRFPEEVDAVVGGVIAVDAAALASHGGMDGLTGDLGMLNLCLAIRSSHKRVVVVPQVVVKDGSTLKPQAQEATAFRKRWGFDWMVPNLAEVRRTHPGSGLLWNVRYHAEGLPFEKYAQRPAVHWDNYAKVNVYRQRADHLAKLTAQICPRGHIVDLGCGDGLFCHLFAKQPNVRVTGVDPEALAIDQAKSKVAGQTYPDQAPQFLVGSGEAIPTESGTADAVTMLDVIEHLPNPVAVLNEVARILVPGGQLMVTTPAWQYGQWSDPVYHVTEYTGPQLVGQIGAIEGLRVASTGQISGVYRDLIVIATKIQP